MNMEFNNNRLLKVKASSEELNLEKCGAWIWKNNQMSLSLIVNENLECRKIAVEIKNIGPNDIFIDEIEILNMTLQTTAPLNFMRFGFNMPGDPVLFGQISKNGFLPAPLPADTIFCEEREDLFAVSSNTLMALKFPDICEKTFVLGSGSFNVTEGTIDLMVSKISGQPDLVYKMILDRIRIPTKTTKTLDAILIIEADDLNSALKIWAEKTATEMGSRIPDEIPTGWNDWQYYRNDKTQKDVLDSAEIIAMLKRQGYPLDFVQIDGGFCMHLSEWNQPKPSFNLGIKKISELINEMGLKFGLWFAPYIQNVNTTVVKEHPEWLLRNSRGEIVKLENSNVGASCLIDYSHKDAAEWLKKQISRFVTEWNVKWIKLDGPNYLLYRKGRLDDSSTTIHEMLMKTFKIMRDAAGENVLIEGEGPMGLALGSVNMQRVQTDNHPIWNIDNNSKRPYAPCVYGKELAMAFLHSRWWCNHRENIILRDFSSPFSAVKLKDPDAEEQIFSENEMQTQLVSALMSPGGLLLTDPMKELIRNTNRMKYIHQILPVWNQASEIIDEFPENKRFPSLYKMKIDLPYETYYLVAAINWDSWTDNFHIDAGQITGEDHRDAYFAFSFFDQQVFEFSGTLDIKNVSAHGARLFAIRKKLPHPQFISSNMHMAQGAVELKEYIWNECEEYLDIKVKHFYQKNSTLFIYLPPEWKITHIGTNASRFHLNDFNPEFQSVTFDGAENNETWFKFFFTKVENSPCKTKLEWNLKG